MNCKKANIGFLLLLLTADPISAAPQAPIKIYVSGYHGGHLTNPEISDAVVDLKNNFLSKRYKKSFTVVDDKEQAEMVVLITGRYVGSEIIGSQTSINRGIFGGLYATNTPIVSTWAYMFADIYFRNDVAKVWSCGKWWRASASYMADYIKRFVEVNYSLIRR